MQTDVLSVTFSALADPTRRAILMRLAEGEASVGELAKPFDLSLPTVSRHLKVLAEANLIERQKDAQWRRCKLTPEPLRTADEWIGRYRAFWEQRLDALARYLADSQAKTKPRGKMRRAKREDK
jgi:DNA-binding transcriptional ArsR family regulator